MLGVNLVHCDGDDAKALREWYSGPTLVDCLGQWLLIHLYDVSDAFPRQIRTSVA